MAQKYEGNVFGLLTAEPKRITKVCNLHIPNSDSGGDIEEAH
jgi:hypothetical protein